MREFINMLIDKVAPEQFKPGDEFVPRPPFEPWDPASAADKIRVVVDVVGDKVFFCVAGGYSRTTADFEWVSPVYNQNIKRFRKYYTKGKP